MTARPGTGQNPGMPENRKADPDRVRRRLERAVRTGGPVRTHRSIPGADRIDGFVVAVTDAWTLLACRVNLTLDGWTALRTSDIVRVERDGGPTCLAVRVLEHREQWPVRTPGGGLPLDELPALAEAACERYGLISLHTEFLRTDACWIGAVAELRPRSLRLHQVGTEARWYPAPTKFRHRDITRVEFGGQYEQTLREFAGPRP